jgi:hypothetical protein
MLLLVELVNDGMWMLAVVKQIPYRTTDLTDIHGMT